jgi:hypothetical protein
MAGCMETPRAFAALVCLAVACSSPDFSSVSDMPEPSAGRRGSAGGSGGKTGGSAAASGRGATAGSGTVSSGGTGGTGGAAGDGQGGSGGDGATGASGGSVGGTDAMGGSGGDGGSSGATGGTGGATGTGGDLGSGGDAASGGTTGGAGGSGGLGSAGLGGGAGVGGIGVGGIGVGGIGVGGIGVGGTAGSAGMPGTGGGLGGAGGGSGSGGMLGGCDNQLLANADFEAGPTPSWQEESDKAGLEIIVSASDAELMAEGVAPYAGSYLAWLGGIADNMWDHYDVILRQNVAIPEDASALTLSGFYHIKSDDSPTTGYDVAYLEFETDAGTIWQAVHWTNVDQTSSWQPFTSTTDDTFQLDALRGQTVTFVAYSRTDPTGKTSFFLDNLKLEAECGR